MLLQFRPKDMESSGSKLLPCRLAFELNQHAGLRIQRMPSEENQEFGNPAGYDYMTVASPSCHDTSTTRAWWEEDAERRERFFYLVSCSTPASI